MTKIICLIAIISLLSGCDFIAPSVSKARTERRQARILEQQNQYLERIATALEKRGQ